MSVLLVLVPVALALVLAAVVAYVWAARRGQFDDLTTPALRMLGDDHHRAAGSLSDIDPAAGDVTSPYARPDIRMEDP